MNFIVSVLSVFAAVAVAQGDTASSATPAQPSSAPAAPAAPNSSNGISIISPTGTRAYKSGEKMVVTWNILGDDPEYQYTDVQFQICDASGGANKVSPIGAYLTNTTAASVGLLSISADVPANIPPGNAYTVRAEIRGTTGFIYFFSPNFPINKDLAVSAAPTAAASASAGAAVTTASAVATAAPGQATTTKSGAISQVLGTLAMLPVMLWL
ncbi:hypothetical protein BJ741DRAFT_614512 [Chytriomyces cf. hyalinus JEL632]|nr:hypothetical protein BJ741DRAFT_614512 [Chytriomyces cf. hyalinus JEL632]